MFYAVAVFFTRFTQIVQNFDLEELYIANKIVARFTERLKNGEITDLFDVELTFNEIIEEMLNED